MRCMLCGSHFNILEGHETCPFEQKQKQKQKRARDTSIALERVAKPKEEKDVVYGQVYCFSCGFSHVGPTCY